MLEIVDKKPVSVEMPVMAETRDLLAKEPAKLIRKGKLVAPKKEGHWKGWIKPTLKTIGQEAVSPLYAAAGIAETATAFGTGMAGMAAAGFTKLGALALGGKLEEAERKGEAVAEAITVHPKTKQGKALLGTLSYPIEKLSEYGKKRADIEFEKTGSPVSAAAKKTLYDIAPILAGAKGGRAGAKKLLKSKVKPAKGMKVPEFKTTGEALKYGKEATQTEIKNFRKVRDQIIKDSEALQKAGKLQEAHDLGVKSQYLNEAILASEGRRDLAKGPVIKQRKWKSKGVDMEAPKVHQRSYDTVREMNELREKPLGGWLETPIRTMEELGPRAKELFYDPIKDAEYSVALERTVVKQSIRRLRKGISTKSSKRIGTYAIAKQKGGAKRLSAMGIKEIPKLTSKETAVYKSLRTEFESLYKRLNVARKAAGKDPFPKVDNYFTFMQDMTLMERLGFNPIFTKASVIENQFIHLKTTPFRFAKMRGKKGLTRMEIDAFDIYDKYSESAIKHIHLSPEIAKGREMLLTFGSKKAGNRWILKENKPRAAKFLTEWLDFQAGQKPVTNIPKLIENGLLKLNQNLTYAILSANIRSALIQPSAILNTYAYIGPKYTYKGIVSLLSPEKRAMVMGKSNLITRSYDIAVNDAMRAVRSGRIGKIKKTVGGVGLKPLQILDIETAKATWVGAYELAKKEYNFTDKKAVRYANDVVAKTQASAAPSDIAPIQRTPLGKSLTLFQTFVINEWGFITKDVLGIKNAKMTNKKTFQKVTRFIVGATLINSFYEDVLGINSPHPTPIRAFQEALEKGEDFPSATWQATKEIGEKIPI
ncbi:MAG: hypothetical protein E3J54_03655, partial [Actinobacteria bacterium]